MALSTANSIQKRFSLFKRERGAVSEHNSTRPIISHVISLAFHGKNCL